MTDRSPRATGRALELHACSGHGGEVAVCVDLGVTDELSRASGIAWCLEVELQPLRGDEAGRCLFFVAGCNASIKERTMSRPSIVSWRGLSPDGRHHKLVT